MRTDAQKRADKKYKEKTYKTSFLPLDRLIISAVMIKTAQKRVPATSKLHPIPYNRDSDFPIKPLPPKKESTKAFTAGTWSITNANPHWATQTAIR